MAIIGTPAQQFVPIREVRDGIMVMKDGTLAMAVLVSSVNLSLKSADEQQATLMQFQNFLNTLDFPIQIVIQSRRYDIRPYILTLQNRLKEQVEPLLQVQTREYIQFIQSFTDQVNIMRKNFFVVVPYIPPILSQESGIGKLFSFLNKKAAPGTADISDFEEQRTQLEERVSVVEQGLTRVGLRVAQLGTEEVIELLYKTFNPGESTSQASMTS
jgi:type IV secretory pathway VirB4 component